MKQENEKLFKPFTINGCEVKNRSVSNPMSSTIVLNSSQFLTKESIDFYVQQAQNGVGMIIAGAQTAGSQALQRSTKLLGHGLQSPANYMGKLQRMIDKVSKFGAKIFVSLHANNNTALPKIELERRTESKSIIERHFLDTELNVLENTDDEKLVEHFTASAKIAQIVGYHGIQVNLTTSKTAHNTFVTDYTVINDSVDDIFNQFRVATKVVKSIKETCGESFPVTLNVSLSHHLVNYFESQFTEEKFYEPELTYDEFIEDFRRLEKAGYDAFNLSTTPMETSNWYLDELYSKPFFNLSENIKRWVNVPVIIGGYKSNVKLAENTIGKGLADAVEMEDSAKLELPHSEKGLINNDDYFVPSYFWIA